MVNRSLGRDTARNTCKHHRMYVTDEDHISYIYNIFERVDFWMNAEKRMLNQSKIYKCDG